MRIKVMSFNLRVKVEADGINNFENRKGRVLEVIKRELPDLIGFQEATNSMRAWLREVLSDNYIVLGCGRNSDYRGETPCLAYRKDIFELVSLDSFWLSDTPEVPGSRYQSLDQSSCPRVTFCATLSPEGREDCIRFINTHLDHSGAQARVHGMKQILDKLGDGTFVLTGDMNATPDSECIAIINAVEGVTDLTAHIPTTFHNFGRLSTDFKIDYIFTNATPVDAYAIEDGPIDGVYISDHYPVVANIDI
jgi:endonuclease/exonuclease/phosphatase family metal-dependent hydrolase